MDIISYELFLKSICCTYVVPSLFFRNKKGLQSLETLVVNGSERGARSPDLRVMNCPKSLILLLFQDFLYKIVFGSVYAD